MSDQWITILDADGIRNYHDQIARLDPAFARQSGEFWESRTAPQLRVLKAQAWNCNNADSFQLATSYLAVIEG